MNKRTGLSPRVRPDAAGSGVVSQAGGITLTETIRAAGLGQALSEALGPWRKPTAVHDPAKVILDLAVALAPGGDGLADIAMLRAEPGVYGPVASDPTVSRTIDALAVDAPWALAAINAARFRARERVWSLAGDGAPDAGASLGRPMIINVDAMLVTAHSEKEHARATFKRGYGYTRLGVRLLRQRRDGRTARGAAATGQRGQQHRHRPHHRSPVAQNPPWLE